MIEIQESRASCGSAVLGKPVEQRIRVLRPLLELDPGVQILGVLVDDHEVDVLVARPDAVIALAGAHLRVEAERLAQADVDRAEAAPHGVVIGPLSATPFSRIDSSTCSGSGLPPCSSMTSVPASRTSQAKATPVASSTLRVASASSGPVPSPGMRVMRAPSRRRILRTHLEIGRSGTVLPWTRMPRGER